jgi:hypothetical protein
MLSNKEEYTDCLSARSENFSTEVLFMILIKVKIVLTLIVQIRMVIHSRASRLTRNLWLILPDASK